MANLRQAILRQAILRQATLPLNLKQNSLLTIFPIGDLDPRLPVHEDVIGVLTASGKPVAFQRSAALLTLRAGKEIAVENVRLKLDAGGIRAVDADGSDLGSHEAFWFAWSQFHPATALWPEQ